MIFGNRMTPEFGFTNVYSIKSKETKSFVDMNKQDNSWYNLLKKNNPSVYEQFIEKKLKGEL